MTELKKCPFCGGEATLVGAVYNDQHYNYVICSNDDCNANTGRCDTKDEAIAKWNTRPNPWHTGTPTEDGWYLVAFNYEFEEGVRYTTDYFKDGKWAFPMVRDISKVVKWQKIEDEE